MGRGPNGARWPAGGAAPARRPGLPAVQPKRRRDRWNQRRLRSPNFSTLLGEAILLGTRGDRVWLDLETDSETRQRVGELRLIVEADGNPVFEASVNRIQRSEPIFEFADSRRATIRYWLSRGAANVGRARFRLSQRVTGAIVMRTLRPWATGPYADRGALAPGAEVSQTCQIQGPLGNGPCGPTVWSASPYFEAAPFGILTFQSEQGTGASSQITVTFAKAISAATITVFDPTFAGNTATARDSAGLVIGTRAFPFSGQAGVNIPATDSIAGPIRTLVLTPASLDFVAYSVSFRLSTNVRVVITYAAGTPLVLGGRPLVHPSDIDPAVMGPRPLFGVTPWPTQLTFEVKVDSAGVAVPNSQIQLAIAAVDSAGRSTDAPFGHFHGSPPGDPKPAGQLSAPAINTGPSGRANVTFTAPSVAGPIVLLATHAAADTARDTVTVGVPFLIQIPVRQSIALIGDVPPHTDNHRGHATMVTNLIELADSVFGRFSRPLYYNDLSLPWGGRFDIRGNWRGSHFEHRNGRDIDVRTNGTPGGLSTRERTFVRDLWESLGGTVHDETVHRDGTPNTTNPHYHLRYRGAQ